MSSPAGRTVAAAAGGVAAAFASALCCAGPLIFVALGLSGAGLSAIFEPLRPYFVGAAVLALGFGFYTVRREDERACEPGTTCASPIARQRMRRLLWIAMFITIPLLTFPWWSALVL